MDVVSNCPLRVASIVWQRRPGAWALTVVCKATFQLQPGEAELLEEQEAPVEDDAYWDGDRTRSLCAPSDLVPFKKRADILLVGAAFAPGGQPVRSLRARLVVGEADKSVDVWCDRIFWQDGRVLEGQPFTSMSLRYERAAGGPGTPNPVGLRFDAPPDQQGAVRIPNLQRPGAVIAGRGDVFAPIGFGPIAPGWPERAGKIPQHVGEWSYRAWKGRALPEGLDAGYFNAAPRDQQVESISAEERIVLENLHAEIPRLVTRLPGIQPRAIMTSGGRAGEEIALVGDTLWIDTVRAVATVVWRGSIALRHPEEDGLVAVSIEEGLADTTVALHGAGGPGVGAGVPRAASKVGGVVETLPGAVSGGPALPFVGGKSPWAAFQAQPQGESSAGKGRAERLAEDAEGTGTLMGAPSPVREVLPFMVEKPRVREPEASVMIRPAPVAEAPMVNVVEVPVANTEAPRAPEPSAPEPAEPTVPAEPPVLEQETTWPPAAFTLERCAGIAASIARRRRETTRILEDNELDPAAWAALEQHYNAAILDEARRGKTGLLKAYDAAYVSKLEEERGPLVVEEYARLVVAAERGNVNAVLAELGLPETAMMRIERVWIKKVMGDPVFGKRVNKYVTAARLT